ncbi:MAG: hypothetical protein ACT4NX_02035 [Deltaproteobacteria bacterium]
MKRLFTLIGIVLAIGFYAACAGVDVDTSELASLEEPPSSANITPAPSSETPAGTETAAKPQSPPSAQAAQSQDPQFTAGLSLSQITRLVESELNRAAAEQVIFNSPQQIAVGSKKKVEVRISNALAEDITKAIRTQRGAEAEGLSVVGPKKVSLAGEGFDIQPRNPVASGNFTQWDFDVTPMEIGERILSLAVTVAVAAPNAAEQERTYKLFDKKINVAEKVEFTIGAFLENYLLWIVSVIIIAAVAGYIARELYNESKSGKAA